NFIEALISKGELFDEYEYQNKRYFSFGRKIEGTNWFLIITYPREEAFESLNSRITAFALIIFAILIICTAVSDLFQRKLVLVPIRTVIERLISSSDHFQVSSRKLSSASQQLAEGSSEQVASLETTSATMEETASMVKQNTENTRQTAILSSKSTDSAKDGFIKMSELNASMEEIKNSSDDIAKIIQVINEIAFQTNILALNAAVEAAKAGEVGASFAVVAEEVRNLAQRSANAAQDTAAKIDRNIELSQKGVDECGLVSRSFEEIKDSTEKVNALIAGIKTASEEQARGTEQIAKAISQIWQVTQKNAALAEESSASSEEIQTQSEEIVAIVGDLNRFVK
ncbi:MAG: methyl-accepting chemotaxis protein, partial [Smithella sp.]